ncbi:type VI secretion system-associated lipoprotein [Enterovibrio norvegicus FF-33]|uniref:type VI secretion system lipoprotein TssJ n=1 Tax=Enterovibrio TaxID=188143 RepID=UPI0003051783|nr:type VI secretion system lipoprotein TssJ [Enterovibrio norvegicus]OEE66107.1 type VI secretion system-associated lipoprotein [Enterovibrio norvegicus FF-33]
MKTFLVSLLSIGLLMGCSSSVSVNPVDWFSDATAPQFTIDIRAESNINPNVDNLPSPVEIRIYQLADSEAFNQADFIQLYNDDQGALKAGLLSKRYLPSVMPGETRREVILANAETKFVGVIVAFANYREANNKAIFTSFGNWSQTITLQLDGINLTMTGTED